MAGTPQRMRIVFGSATRAMTLPNAAVPATLPWIPAPGGGCPGGIRGSTGPERVRNSARPYLSSGGRCTERSARFVMRLVAGVGLSSCQRRHSSTAQSGRVLAASLIQFATESWT